MMQNRKMFIIGLTGGIGSGKSEAAALAEKQLDCAVIYTDLVAREQTAPGGCSYKGLKELLGEGFFLEDGQLDRAALAAAMVEEDSLRRRVNAVTHPNVTKYVNKKIDDLRSEGKARAVLIETAILHEAGYDSFCDAIWYIRAPEKDRRGRLEASRGYDKERIDGFFEKQLCDREFIEHCTDVIENGNCISRKQLLMQMEKALRRLL